jgi:PAS domain S-box-containing protein
LIFRDQKDIEKEYDFILKKGDRLTAEVFVPLLRKGKGAYLWGIAAPLYDSCGNVVGAIESIRDITESKRAEEALLESEALYSAVVGQAFDIIFLVDVKTKIIVDGNIAFQKMLGYSSNELSGLTLYNIVAHDKESIERNIDRIKASGKYHIGPRQYRRKDGSIIDVEASSTIIHYGKKEVLCVIARDITERKRVEEALRESEARYKRIVETANEGIMIMDDQFRYTFVNQKLADMLGYRVGEILGRPVTSFIFEEEDLPDHLAMMEMRVSGAGAQYERRHRCKDGSCCWTIVSATPLKDEAGQFAGSFAMLTDITESMHMLDALRESEQEKTAILGGLRHVAVEYLDPRMRIIWVNEAVQMSLGLSIDELRGEYCFEILQGLKKPCPGCTALKASETGHSQEGELVTPDGKTWISRGSPIKNSDGSVQGVVHVAMNITERKRAEEEIASNLEDLKRSKMLIQQSNSLLEAIMASPNNIVVFALDNGYRYLAFNQNHKKTMKAIWGVDI